MSEEQRDRREDLDHTQPGRGPVEHMRDWCVAQYKEFVAAVGFLSVLPMPGASRLFRTDRAEAQLVIGSAYFPLVGLLIAGLLALLPLVAGPYLPPLVLAALLVVAHILLTGGLHLDGLMDACDGLFGGRSRERKLEIMRDSRVGSFGVLGGASILLLKFALYASLERHHLVLALLMVLPAARWAMVLALRLFPSARPSGLGAAVRQVVTVPRTVFAALLALGIALAVGHLAGVAVWCTATLVALVLSLWVNRQLGGLTGDIYGALAETGEVCCLLLVVVLRF